MSGPLVDRLTRGSSDFLDTSVLIYYVEEDERYQPLLRLLFERIDSGEMTGLSSTLTLLEVMVKPLRDGRREIASAYCELLTSARGFTLHPIDRDVAVEGAAIRATHRFTTPDAIQLAAARVKGAAAFVTNDGRLRRYPDVEVLVLGDLT
jgi:predicted nucleic acid-binding protein